MFAEDDAVESLEGLGEGGVHDLTIPGTGVA
jgi:hypothetical protein